MKKISVVAAVIQYQNEVLCVQRNVSKFDYISYKYEFPGGKIEEQETPEQAIIREIQEELCMDIMVDSHLITVDHDYPDFSIELQTFLCKTKTKNLKLIEHIDFQWLKVQELSNLDWADADKPIIEELLRISKVNS